jgi:hypothetical protein
MDTKNQKDKNIAAEERPRPSQAEGEENPGGDAGNRPTPSQAEGDRATVEQDLERK